MVILFIQCNFDFQAMYVHHNHILPGLFNICPRFNYNSPTGFSVFQDQSEPPSTCPRPVCCNLSLCTPSFHTCRARYLQDSQDPNPQPSGDLRLHVSVIRTVMTDSIRFGIWGMQSWPVFPNRVRAAHSIVCAHRCRLL